MAQKISAVKGMNDLLPDEIGRFQHIEGVARSLFGRFGYRELRTPIVEETALFVRGVGEVTDIVQKEMYRFPDRKGRDLSLRPEGTASAVRAYVEHDVQVQDPVTKWFYVGPMFRYERPQKGRYRQFHQVGAELFGAGTPEADAELIDMAVTFASTLDLGPLTLHLNTLGDDACRPAYVEKLVGYLKGHAGELCQDCQVRLERNPMRVLDCKQPGCKAVVSGAPVVLESLCEPCRAHFERLQQLLGDLGVAFEVDPRIVRGLDYYTRTVFELLAPSTEEGLGAQSTVLAGGRYDKLVKLLGGPEVPAIGFACGMERLALLLKAKGRTFEEIPELFLASLGEPAQRAALKLASTLRKQGLSCELDLRGGSLKSQMRRADKLKARFAVVLGERELAERKVRLKAMAGGEEAEVALDGLLEAIRSRS